MLLANMSNKGSITNTSEIHLLALSRLLRIYTISIQIRTPQTMTPITRETMIMRELFTRGAELEVVSNPTGPVDKQNRSFIAAISLCIRFV